MYDYLTYQTTMQQMLGVNDPQGQALLAAIMPRMIEYAELRIYRELSLVDTTATAVATCTVGSRSLVVPETTLIVLEQITIITPAGAMPDAPGSQRKNVRQVSKDFVDLIGHSQGVPRYFNLLQTNNAILAPTPDQAYNAEMTGEGRPLPLGPATDSTTQTTTVLTTYFPDLFLTASMIFGAAYQHNFGAQADDPKMALSWETTYQLQIKSAAVEEARKEARMANFSSDAPRPSVPQGT